MKQTQFHERGQTIKLANFAQPRDCDLSEYEIKSNWANDDEHVLLTRPTIISVPVGQARDISKAQLLTYTILFYFYIYKGTVQSSGFKRRDLCADLL